MIVIKKRVSLDFLGEEYKDSYLMFKSIPAIDFDEVMSKLKSIEGKQEGSLGFLLDILKKYFISGEFFNDGKLQEVTEEDLGQLDAPSIIECFKVFTGQTIDPKAETPSTNSSPMVESHQVNS